MKTLALVTSCAKEVDKWDDISIPGMDHLIVCGNPDLEANYILEGSVLYVKCRDTYDGLPEKIISALNAFEELYPKDAYTHILKIDSDAYIGEEFDLNVPQVFENDYVGRVKFKQGSRHYHFGRVDIDSYWFNRRWGGDFSPFICGGSSYVLSTKAVSVITSHYGFDEVHNDVVYKEHITEDSMIGIILNKGGIKPTVYDYGVSRQEDRDREIVPDIDMIYYINLDYRKDRRRHMERLLDGLKIPYQRKSAVRPTFGDLVYTKGKYHNYFERVVGDRKPWIRGDNKHRFIGMMGAYISHVEVLNDIKEKGYKRVLVLEDDIKFSASTLHTIKKYIKSSTIGPNWDMIRSLWRKDIPRDKKVIKILDPHRYSLFKRPNQEGHNITGGAHFTIINGDKIDKILDYMNKELIYDVDGVYSTNQLNVVCGFFNVSTGSFGTDIPKNGGPSIKKLVRAEARADALTEASPRNTKSTGPKERNLVVQIFFDHKLISNKQKTHTNHNRGPLITSRMRDYSLFYESQRRAREYAKKCGAEYVLFDNPVTNFFSASMERMRLIEEDRWARDYDNILYLDCDTIISDHCPDLFKLYPQKNLRVCHTLMTTKWLLDKESMMAERFGKETLAHEYFNGGVLLFHSSTLKAMKGKLKYRERFNTYAFDDQSELNWVVMENNIPVTFMERRFNAKPGTNVMITHYLGNLKHRYKPRPKAEKITSVTSKTHDPDPNTLVVKLKNHRYHPKYVTDTQNEITIFKSDTSDRFYDEVSGGLILNSPVNMSTCAIKAIMDITKYRNHKTYLITFDDYVLDFDSSSLDPRSLQVKKINPRSYLLTNRSMRFLSSIAINKDVLKDEFLKKSPLTFGNHTSFKK